MKTISKPIEMISVTDTNGSIKPIRFRIKDNNEELQKVKILSVDTLDQIKYMGILTLEYNCTIMLPDSIKRACVIRYDQESCIWTLHKM